VAYLLFEYVMGPVSSVWSVVKNTPIGPLLAALGGRISDAFAAMRNGLYRFISPEIVQQAVTLVSAAWEWVMTSLDAAIDSLSEAVLSGA
jgi:hypothetical protein